MAGFVLIHGSWHGGWCFDPVADILRARGHAVLAPTLPGMGGTAQELAAVTLAGWADFALEHCRRLRAETGGPVVLAGTAPRVSPSSPQGAGMRTCCHTGLNRARSISCTSSTMPS